MLLLILQAAQEAKQIAPNVYVMPAPAGMPEWAKIVISASVGAVFGVGGNIMMEMLKPKISKGSSRREVVAQLVTEVRRNREHLESIRKALEEGENDKSKNHALYVLNHIWDDRYRYYKKEQPILVYEIDRHKSLDDFYYMCKTDLPNAIRAGGKINSTVSGPASSSQQLVEYADHIGSLFIERNTRSI
jgi:hypothetical protein